MQEECYTRINKNAPGCVDNTGNTGKLATVDDEQDAEIDPSLVRHLNGFVRSVKDQEETLPAVQEHPLPDLLIPVVTRLMKCPLFIKG